MNLVQLKTDPEEITWEEKPILLKIIANSKSMYATSRNENIVE